MKYERRCSKALELLELQCKNRQTQSQDNWFMESSEGTVRQWCELISSFQEQDA